MPEEVIFIRSDQYSFVKKGVPAVFLIAGFKGQAAKSGATGFGTWIRDIYHTQKDDMNQYIDWNAGVRFTMANLMIGYEVANQPERPTWNQGDYFGELALLGSPRRTASVVAVTDMEVLVANPREFRALLRVAPGFADEIEEISSTRRLALAS